MSSKQMDLNGEPVSVPDHLTKRVQNLNVQLPVEKEREYGCRECENRVTQNAARTAEYGHEPACGHHFDGGVQWR